MFGVALRTGFQILGVELDEQNVITTWSYNLTIELMLGESRAMILSQPVALAVSWHLALAVSSVGRAMPHPRSTLTPKDTLFAGGSPYWRCGSDGPMG